jgi:insulysin
LGYAVGVGARGVSLTVLGYSPKLPTLAAKVFREFGDPSFWQSVDPSLVELCKERMLRSMRSWSKERPDTQADGLLNYMMQENVWLPQDRLLAAETITAESFIIRAQSSLMKRKVTSYVHGNMNQEEALSLNDQCIDALAVNDGEAVRENLLVNEEGDIPARARLLTGHTVVALADPNPDDPNSALLTHIQMGVTTAKNAAIMAVLRSIMGEPLFAELRTKKQVGYIVSLSSSGYGRSPGTIRGLTVRLLSNRFSPLTMQVLLGEFFESQKEVFATLTQADLSNRTAAICQTLMDPPTSYTEESGGFWGSIISGMPFDWTEQVIEELRKLQTEDVQIAANEWLFNENRKSASIMLFGNSHIEELNKVNSGDMESVKGFFPALKNSVICGSFEELTKQRDALEYTSL